MYKLLQSLSPRVEVLGFTLFENKTYYLILESPEESLVSTVLNSEPLRRHIKWHSGNRVAELRVDQFIGKIRIFDQEYDVTSSKFGEGLNGSEQLKLIISDLDSLSKKISFSYNTSVYARTNSDWQHVQEDYVHRLNYLYQYFFSKEISQSVAFFFNQIKRDVCVSYQGSIQRQEVWKVREATPLVLNELVRRGGITDGRINANIGRINFSKQTLTRNNSENQFIKFFFNYCAHIALQVISSPKYTDKAVISKASKLLHECRSLLNDVFFKGVDLPVHISTNSTVLTRRMGYKDLFHLYTTSLFSLRHMYDEFLSSSETSLIDISTLYEIWCFYHVSYEILGGKVLVTEKSSTLNDGKIRYSTVFENNEYSVSYNKSFSIFDFSSYSTTLRPDISVFSKEEKKHYHFDAKYRVNSYIASDQTKSNTFKNDDVNKMHAYLDAIYDSASSVVLYPGDEYRFFVRAKPAVVVRDLKTEHNLNGVGALPLIPGKDNQTFKGFIKKYFG